MCTYMYMFEKYINLPQGPTQIAGDPYSYTSGLESSTLQAHSKQFEVGHVRKWVWLNSASLLVSLVNQLD